MSAILDQLIGIIAPHSCVACGKEGKILCALCNTAAVIHKKSTCFMCNRLTEGWRTCQSCRSKTRIGGVVVLSHYEGAIKKLIRMLKYERAVAAADCLADLMVANLEPANFDLVSAVPAASKRYRQRGYNQAHLIAKQIAKRLGLHSAETLGKTGDLRQVGTSRRQRLKQVEGTMYVRRPRLVKGQRILVVDDVVTTGATISEAARVLKAAGAKSVWGAAIAKH